MFNQLISNKARFIIGTDNGKDFENMYKVLSHRQTGYEKVTFDDIESFDKPTVDLSHIRFNYTYADLEKIALQYHDIPDFFVFASSVCGVKIDDEFALSLIGAPEEKTDRYLRAIITIDDKPFTMRVVPDGWGDSKSRLSTNFHIKGTSLFLEDIEIGQITSYCNLCSINNIAYISKNLQDKNVLCVNPLQSCYQGCKFCLRTQEVYSKGKKTELLNLSPEQLCRYLCSELPDIQFENLNEFYISTGRFRDTNHVLDYLRGLQKSIFEQYGSKFDPIRRQDQWFKVSTHLLNTLDSMKEAQSLGVKKYLYPIEIVSDMKRKFFMHRSGLMENKGEVSFEEVISVLDLASSVFGKTNIEPVLIIGIDTHMDTMKALRILKSEGYRMISYNVFRAYYEGQLQYYHMDFGEIVDVVAFIDSNFSSGYSQIVDLNNKSVRKSYIGL
jgi:hypothetical protein